jgi:lysophospholipase L1-like esterase
MRIAAVLVVVCAAFATGGSAALTRSVYVDGDSLAEGTAPFLQAFLPHWSLRESYTISRHVTEGVALLRAEAPRLERVVVVSLGTNDDPRFVAAFRTGVRQMLAIAGPTGCVVWTNIVRPPAVGASYEAYNRVLAAQAAAHRNLVVVDWQALVRKQPAWLRADGVHATVAGYRARAAAIAAAVKECTLRSWARSLAKRRFRQARAARGRRAQARSSSCPRRSHRDRPRARGRRPGPPIRRSAGAPCL